MSNPLFNVLNQGAPNQMVNAPINPQFTNMLNQFQEFKRNFNGDPESIVKDMLRTGRMTQAQYDAIQAPARTLYNLLNH